MFVVQGIELTVEELAAIAHATTVLDDAANAANAAGLTRAAEELRNTSQVLDALADRQLATLRSATIRDLDPSDG